MILKYLKIKWKLWMINRELNKLIKKAKKNER